MNHSPTTLFIKWFADIRIEDVPQVGGNNASLGEMVRELAGQGVKVPDGFAITAEAFRHFIREAGSDGQIRRTLADLNTHDMANLSGRGQAVRQAILSATLPADLQTLISDAYRQLQGGSAVPLDVAVRSSATAEDLPDASFAGQQETYLNVHGTAALLETCKRCFASLFTDRAINDTGGGKMVKNVPVAPGDRAKLALTDDEVLELARWACIVEDHYSAKRGQPAPMELEWAKDGITGELFIVQARPETVQSRKDLDVLESFVLGTRSKVLTSGRSVGAKIATGRVRVIRSAEFIGQFQEGDDRPGHRHLPRQGPQDRHLRPGAERLPGVRPVPRRARHRQHLAQS